MEVHAGKMGQSSSVIAGLDGLDAIVAQVILNVLLSSFVQRVSTSLKCDRKQKSSVPILLINDLCKLVSNFKTVYVYLHFYYLHYYLHNLLG